MLTSVRYFDLVREMKNAYNHRLRLVESAKQRGIKPTARLFGTTVLVITSLKKLLRPPKSNSSNSAKLFLLSVPADSSASSIYPSATALWSASGASMAC
jgi:hypothetical protein